ncbi:hypothetical protein MMC15_002682 [Xylographa vitiligo]|nr:hypothetical protein [Xylographa vitiligo]
MDGIHIIPGVQRLVTNTTTGGSGGTKFTLTNGKKAVKQISVWVARGSNGWNDRDLIKAVKLTWKDEEERTATGKKEGATEYTFEFHDDETVTDLQIWTGDRVDRLKLTTSENRRFEKGGTGGAVHSEQIGNGVLLGFTGYADSQELISLGTKFKEDFD